MRIRSVTSALLGPMVVGSLALGLAGCDGKPKGRSDGRKDTDCVWSDRLFSNGASVCVASKRALTCDKGKWTESSGKSFAEDGCTMDGAPH